MTDLVERIRARLAELNLGEIEAAVRVPGLERNYIRDLLIGKKRSFSAAKAPLVAQALQWTEAELRGDPAYQSTVRIDRSPTRMAPIVGVVQAGMFREIEDMGDWEEPEMMSVPADLRFPDARQIVFVAEGDSMNMARPAPILPGSRLICVDFDDINRPLTNGWNVVVERTRDGGFLREISVKEVEVHADRVIFHPRSSNPKHRPFEFPLNSDPDDGQTVRILALVRSVQTDMTL